MKRAAAGTYWLATEPLVIGLSLTTDVVGWAADRFADVAEETAAVLTDWAGTARWIATLTRCTP